MPAIADRIKVIDVDTHVSEPEDLWTSRVSKKWGDLIPHVVRDPRGQRHPDQPVGDVWIFGGELATGTGLFAMAGHDKYFPQHPPTLADADPAAFDAKARLERMDEYGLHAQVLYPNVAGFGSGRFLKLGVPELMLECVQAYNDFLTEWCSEAPERLIPITALPFWDIAACVTEIERCAAQGHRGILFGSHTETFEQPWLGDPAWDPVWDTAQEAGLSINFHIGSGAAAGPTAFPGHGPRIRLIKGSVMAFMDNGAAISEVILSGLCHRFPKLKFVSVESGVGWVPFLLEALDWQWLNNGGFLEHPEFDLLPSEYFRRQVYACFWFEQAGARHALELYPDNVLYESDFPHPTSMSPGPASSADVPKDYIDKVMGDLSEELQQKILHDNAVRVYNLSS